MGASRYMAVEAFTDEQSGREFKPGDFVTGSDYERMGDPEAFRPADYPSEVDQLREEYGLDEPAAATAGFDPADHTVDEVNAHLADADEDEKTRVYQMERDGQVRKGILEA